MCAVDKLTENIEVPKRENIKISFLKCFKDQERVGNHMLKVQKLNILFFT